MNTGFSQTSTLELLQAVQRGDKSAFEKLYASTHRDVFHYILSFLKDAGAAEDVLIEVYLAVWRNASSFQGRSKVKTWIFGIARNQALNALRRSPPTSSLENHPGAAVSGDSGKSAEQRVLVNQALAALSRQHREVLELVFIYGMRYQEIAHLLGIPVNTVKTRIFHAKKAARQLIEEKKETRGREC